MKAWMINRSVVVVLCVSLLLVIGLMVLHRSLCGQSCGNVSKMEVLCRVSHEPFQPQTAAPGTNCHRIIVRESVVVTNWVYGTMTKGM